VKLLDRYVVRNFLQAYVYCIAGFISIWLIFDVSDNISTFIDDHSLTITFRSRGSLNIILRRFPRSWSFSCLFRFCSRSSSVSDGCRARMK